MPFVIDPPKEARTLHSVGFAVQANTPKQQKNINKLFLIIFLPFF